MTDTRQIKPKQKLASGKSEELFKEENLVTEYKDAQQGARFYIAIML